MLRRKTAGPGPGGSTQPAGSGRSRTDQVSKKSRVRQDMRPDSKRCVYCGPQVWSRISKYGHSVFLNRQNTYRTSRGDNLFPVLDDDADVGVRPGDEDGLRTNPPTDVDEDSAAREVRP